VRSIPRFAAAIGCALLLALAAASTSVQAQDSLRTCGNENEEACGLLQRDSFNGICDSGLGPRLEGCECLITGFFGNCLLRRPCLMCRNDTRHRPLTAAVFATSWANWALRNQREQLAIDEPINWVMHLGTHNSFNSYSDGHQPRIVNTLLIPILTAVSEIADAPNQFYSMSSQLDLGARFLAIDAHFVGTPNNARLCHSMAEGGPVLEAALCLNPSLDNDGDLFPGMRYFANGIKEIENWLRRHPDAILLINLENYVGCAGDKCQGTAEYIADPIRTYLDRRGWILRPTGTSAPFPSRAEMLAAGKRVAITFNGNVAPDIGFSEGDVVAGGYLSWLRNNQDFANCIDNRLSETERHGPANTAREKFSVVVEDRTLQRGFIELIHELTGQGPGAFGELSVEDLRSVARCNYGIVATDFLGSLLPFGRSMDVPDFSRHEALVWSWKTGDRGQNGDCAMLEASSGRWVSADCSQPRRYACAPPRSESGTDDRTNWSSREDRWWITSAAGPWNGGQAACAAEAATRADTDTEYVFSVPVNGYQNDRLKAANTVGVDVWLNYTDTAREGSWVIPRRPNINARPVADAGLDQTIQCGGEVFLDGRGSADADGDPLSYSWSGPFDPVTNPTAVVTLPAGVHVITLTVRDGRGGVDTDSVSITVADSKPPSLEVSVSPSTLTPVNGELVKITASVRARDRCDAGDVLVALHSIVISDPAGTATDAWTDIQGAELGIGDTEFLLRATHGSGGPGRVYSMTYRATDKAGNISDVNAKVTVLQKVTAPPTTTSPAKAKAPAKIAPRHRSRR